MNILIIEDEKPAAEQLKRLLKKELPTAFFHGPLAGIAESVRWFRENPSPDLIFLDIHLSDGHSFEIFAQVEVAAPIIFCTAYDQYALQAFKLNSVDYLLKPVDPEELKRALQKYEQQWSAAGSESAIDLQALKGMMSTPQHQFKERFVIKLGDRLTMVPTGEVDFFYSESKSSFLQTKAGKQYPLDSSLDQLEQMVNPAEFFRINRRYLVRLSAIEDVRSYSSSRLKLQIRHSHDSDILVSRDRTGDFKLWLEGS